MNGQLTMTNASAAITITAASDEWTYDGSAHENTTVTVTSGTLFEVTESGEQLGIMSAKDACKEAEKRSLDLVKIAPNAQPPVCKIMDYGKYRFDQAKKEKEAKKNQKVIETKEIRLSVNIDTHDFDTKVNHALKFLKAGNKVKVSIRFRGREMAHAHLGNGIMDRFVVAVEELGTVNKPAKLEGRQMLMFLSPKSTK